MNLIFDIGNSSTKMAVYKGHKKITSFRTKEFTCEMLQEEMSQYNIKKAIVCSVRNFPDYIYDLLTVNIPYVHVLSHKTKLPFSVDYDTPDTLGADRLAAIAGAYSLFPGKRVLVIDAGSAITIDFLNRKKFAGGNISPGLAMRFKALHKFTGRLPLITKAKKITSPAKNTEDAVTAGVINGIVYEINEYIRTFEKKYPGIKVIFTGGDGEFLMKSAEHKACCIPDLVIDGLNYILDYNAKK